MRTLDELAVGASAQVVAVVGDDQIALRLLEMGILEGEPVELIGRAPWGDPLDVRVRGYRVSIRRTEAQRVQLADG
ncbi:MAG: ferrous iron transport protein A [Pirellulales bacterium]